MSQHIIASIYKAGKGSGASVYIFVAAHGASITDFIFCNLNHSFKTRSAYLDVALFEATNGR